MSKKEFLKECERMEKIVQEVFGPVEMKVLPTSESDDGANPQTRLEKFFSFVHEHGHRATISTNRKGFYDINLFPKTKTPRVVSGMGATVGLALNDLWEEIKKHKLLG